MLRPNGAWRSSPKLWIVLKRRVRKRSQYSTMLTHQIYAGKVIDTNTHFESVS
uniref:NBS-coding resistance gene protein n=1 Tax=Solanum tuberosum TaxID=4113 RepID=M1CGS4_SOLTU